VFSGIPSGDAPQEVSLEKDTVAFSIMLSVIDFFLSMVMISGIGVVLSLLPYLNRLGKLDEESMRRGH
jgi:uncharacterized membrane protein